jgi:putative phosphoesterase
MNNYLIGVISDTHDNLPNINKAVKIFNQKKVSLVIHCGDFVAPFVLDSFQELKCSLIGVIGNCDGEREYLKEKARNYNFSIFEPPHMVNIEKKVILITHKPIPLNIHCDIHLYGHTHKPEIVSNKTKPCLIVNPGEAAGWLFGRPTIALLDVDNLHAEIISLK